MNNQSSTDFLTASSTFVVGMGSVLNVGGNYFSYNESPSPAEADRAAVANDWEMVGQDIQAGIQQTQGRLSER